MKIIQLKIKNLQSLKGEHVINFDVPPLSNAGLFAITGPTGAGKSTILDAITLALFNDVPRFDYNLSKTQIENEGSILTHFATDGYAQIDYTVDGKTYRSSWVIRRAKTGTLQDHHMELATLPDGNIMDLKKSQVPAQNEKIIGLTYDQFVKSIILSQGEFAKFLKSRPEERTSLLENITGTFIYRELGKAAFRKSKEKLAMRDDFQRQSANIEILAEDVRFEIEKLIESNKGDVEKLKIEITTLTNHHKNLQTKQAKSLELTTYNGESKEALHQLDLFQPSLQKLQKHKTLEPFMTSLRNLQNDNKTLNELTTQLKDWTKEKTNKMAITAKAVNDLAELTHTKHTTQENFTDVMRKFHLLVTTLTNKINQVTIQGKDLGNSLTDALQRCPDPTLSKALLAEFDYHQRAEMVRSYISDLAEKKAFSELDSDQLVAKETENNHHLEMLIALDQQVQLLHTIRKQIDSSQDIMKTKSSEKLSKIEPVDLLTKSIQKLKVEIEKLQHEKSEKWKITSLDEHREHLIENEPCPLCGSTDHPYQIDRPLIDILGLDQQIHIFSLNTKNEQTELDKLNKEISGLDGMIQSIAMALDELIKQETELTVKIPQAYHQKSIDELATEMIETRSMSHLIRGEISRRNNVHYATQLLPNIDQVIELRTDYTTKKRELDSYYKGSDVNKDLDEIHNRFSKATNSMEIQQSLISIGQANIESMKKKIEETELKIKLPLQQLGYDSTDKVFDDLLDDETKKRIEITDQQLRAKITESKTKIDLVEADIAKIKLEEGLENNEALLLETLEKQRVSHDHLIDLIGQSKKHLESNGQNLLRKNKIEEDIKLLDIEIGPWLVLQKLIGDAEGKNFAKYAQNLSLKHLIHIANHRLRRLSDRYSLDVTDLDQDLRVIDAYQAHASRSVKTLSGGETFIVSLAMALSLSDMASNNVTLESLFIDEGFGTLDAETLETALETLEYLQAEGNRTIGVISHVDSLKERITTQIRVHKNSQGNSTIDVVG